MRVPRTSRRSNQAILKEISPEHSLEGLMLKLKLQYFGHLVPPDNHDDVITHLEPDIQECEIKWALGSITMIKASGGDGIPVELFQILKNDAVKVLHSNTPENLENSAVSTGLEKVSFHSNPKERQCQRMLKLLHNCTHLTC